MTEWFAQTAADGRVLFRIGRHGERLIADWPGLATLEVDREGRAPKFKPVEAAPTELVEKLEQGAVRALLRHLQGRLTLHAAAVSTGEHAVAFVGDSGAGKSSMAFALAQEGWGLLSDDLLAIEEDVALPTESLCWLDQGTDKRPFAPPHVATEPARLKGIVQLTFVEQNPGLVRLKGAAVGAVLTTAMVRFVIDERDIHRRDLNALADLAARVPLFELRRVRGFDHMSSAVEVLKNWRQSWA